MQEPNQEAKEEDADICPRRPSRSVRAFHRRAPQGSAVVFGPCHGALSRAAGHVWRSLCRPRGSDVRASESCKRKKANGLCRGYTHRGIRVMMDEYLHAVTAVDLNAFA